MSSAVDLQPGNSSALEDATTRMLDARGRLAPELARVAGLGDDVDAIPDDWLPWFVVNEGLDILLPYLSPRDALREGRPWLRELGSEAAIIRALSWVGQHGVTVHYQPDEDEKFDLFQVELAAPVGDFMEAGRIADLIQLSRATSDILGRVRSGLDGDAFRLDDSVLDGPDLLDDWEGIRIPGLGPETPDGPVTWSFGERRIVTTSGGAADVSISLNGTNCIISRGIGGFEFDASRLDDDLVEPADAAAGIVATGTETISTNGKQAPHPHAPHPGYASVDFAPDVHLKITREDHE